MDSIPGIACRFGMDLLKGLSIHRKYLLDVMFVEELSRWQTLFKIKRKFGSVQQ